MTKTCGTCWLWTPSPLNPSVGRCYGACVPVECLAAAKRCSQYHERTDSVEQVAIDAVKLIFDPPNYSRYKLMREAAEGYAERLRALGVDV